MNCSDFLSRHSEYADALVERAEEATLRAHLDACPSCARYDRVVRRGAQLARDLLPRVQVSDDFEPRVRHRLLHARDDLHRRRTASSPFYAAAAVAVLLGGTAAAFVLQAEAAPPSPATSAAVAAQPTPMIVVSAAEPPGVTLLEEAVALIRSEAEAQDPHAATPAGWPVYSRGAAAVAFTGPHTRLVVTPADFRVKRGDSRPAGPLLVRH